MIALAYLGTGSLRLAFLLPSLLAALGALALVYDLGRRLWQREPGRWAALALLFTLQFMLQAKRVQIDMVLVFWTTLALYGCARYLLLGHGRFWWIAGGLNAAPPPAPRTRGPPRALFPVGSAQGAGGSIGGRAVVPDQRTRRFRLRRAR